MSLEALYAALDPLSKGDRVRVHYRRAGHLVSVVVEVSAASWRPVAGDDREWLAVEGSTDPWKLFRSLSRAEVPSIVSSKSFLTPGEVVAIALLSSNPGGGRAKKRNPSKGPNLVGMTGEQLRSLLRVGQRVCINELKKCFTVNRFSPSAGWHLTEEKCKDDHCLFIVLTNELMLMTLSDAGAQRERPVTSLRLVTDKTKPAPKSKAKAKAKPKARVKAKRVPARQSVAKASDHREHEPPHTLGEVPMDVSFEGIEFFSQGADAQDLEAGVSLLLRKARGLLSGKETASLVMSVGYARNMTVWSVQLVARSNGTTRVLGEQTSNGMVHAMKLLFEQVSVLAAQKTKAQKDTVRRLKTETDGEPSAVVRKGTTYYRNVKAKDFVNRGVKKKGDVLLGHNADVRPKEWIRLHGFTTTRRGEPTFDITFRIGDEAVYESTYAYLIGQIVSIGKKTVGIRKGGRDAAVARLSLYDFALQNAFFDADKMRKSNDDNRG